MRKDNTQVHPPFEGHYKSTDPYGTIQKIADILLVLKLSGVRGGEQDEKNFGCCR